MGRDCRELPASIIERLPLRFTYDNNYYNDRYQGIPVGGYTPIIEKLLEGSDLLLETDFTAFAPARPDIAGRTVYTGMIDEFFGFSLGALQYRSLRFESEELSISNFQGCAAVNYTSEDVPFTRIIEHKHFQFGSQPATIITREYSQEWRPGAEPFYPINDPHNGLLYQKYQALARELPDVIFGGRLGEYKYYDMDKVIAAALNLAHKEFGDH